MYLVYSVWFKNASGLDWRRSLYDVKARTDKEAQSMVRRKFVGCGFTSMSMVAFPNGTDPNLVI